MTTKRKVQLALVITAVIMYTTIILVTRDNLFNEEVIEKLDINEITKIEVIRVSDDKTIHVTDQKAIETFMEYFDKLTIRKTRYKEQSFNEAYWITLNINDDRSVGLKVDDTNHLFVYLVDENYMKDYEILDSFDLQFIDKLFDWKEDLPFKRKN